jgi:hypothetical protein
MQPATAVIAEHAAKDPVAAEAHLFSVPPA